MGPYYGIVSKGRDLDLTGPGGKNSTKAGGRGLGSYNGSYKTGPKL